MALLTKKSPTAKKRKKRQRAKKKALRQDKRETRKEARKDKKKVRKKARKAKKAIRKSGASAKEKRQAKKVVRKAKRSDLKSIREQKREDIQEINADLREVRRWLDIQLPKKAANLALLRQDLSEIDYGPIKTTKKGRKHGERELDLQRAMQTLDESYERAKALASRGLVPLEDIVDEPRDRWVDLWSVSGTLVQWFGKVKRPGDVKDVHDRLASVHRRLNRQTTIRLHPQRTDGINAQNNGTFMEPRTFKVFPDLFESARVEGRSRISFDHDYIGSVMIHELIHIWFLDQKINGEKVYGSSAALELASKHPTKARRSAENYEHYCLSFA